MAELIFKDRTRLYAGKNTVRSCLTLAAAATLSGLMWLTSFGFVDRVVLLIDQERTGTLIVFVGIWAVCWVCLITAAIQPNRLVRWFWALVLSVSVAASQAYHLVSGSELGPFDVLSLWEARHEAGRAAAQFTNVPLWFTATFLGSFVLLTCFPIPKQRLWLVHGNKTCWLPGLPVAIIAAIVLVKEGGGSQSLPQHFAPLAVSAITLGKKSAQPAVASAGADVLPTGPATAKNIVVLVDESVRGDYIDLSPASAFTPRLARRTGRLVDFGPAASGGNCSHYSNALLRLNASRRDIVGSLRSNADIWDYAKRAGFRTVFIDAQATVNKNASQLQNFMTVQEAAKIDRFVTFNDVAVPQLDRELIKVVEEELKGGQPVFIYANKNGAHFPYSYGYPEHQTPFGRPGAGQGDSTSRSSMIASYLNNIRWNVDELLSDFVENTDLTNTVVLYTSDHGQVLEPGRMTHCSVENPDPREALVPLLALTSKPDLASRLSAAAGQWSGKAGHFLVMPTVLQLMGYDADVSRTRFGPSLFDVPGTVSVGFTSGDIFGLFRNDVRWHDLDLAKSYLEQDARLLRQTAGPTAKLVVE